jgi:hypothetical protein
MIIRQYVPGIGTGFVPPKDKFNSLQELLAIPFVAKWENDKTFYRFSISLLEVFAGKERYQLMVELDSGKKWFVVGYMWGKNIAKLGLPEWHAPCKLNGELK